MASSSSLMPSTPFGGLSTGQDRRMWSRVYTEPGTQVSEDPTPIFFMKALVFAHPDLIRPSDKILEKRSSRLHEENFSPVDRAEKSHVIA